MSRTLLIALVIALSSIGSVSAQDAQSALRAAARAMGTANVDAVAELVGKYMDIRGYGPVKEQSVREVREQIAAAKLELAKDDRAAA